MGSSLAQPSSIACHVSLIRKGKQASLYLIQDGSERQPTAQRQGLALRQLEDSWHLGCPIGIMIRQQCQRNLDAAVDLNVARISH